MSKADQMAEAMQLEHQTTNPDQETSSNPESQNGESAESSSGGSFGPTDHFEEFDATKGEDTGTGGGNADQMQEEVALALAKLYMVATRLVKTGANFICTRANVDPVTDKEAKEFAGAGLELLALYKVQPTPKAMAWGSLILTAAAIAEPRIEQYQNTIAGEAKEPDTDGE